MAFRINGIGLTLLGVSEHDRDGNSTGTLWFTLLFLPVIPVRRLRVRFASHAGSGFSYYELGREPLKWGEIARTLAYCWLFIPLLAASPVIPAFSENWTWLGLPKSWNVPYIVVVLVYELYLIHRISKRYERRTAPPPVEANA